MHLLTNEFDLRVFGHIPSELRRQFRPTVVVLLYHQDKVVFVQSAKDPTGMTWGLPQGEIEAESLVNATRRETMEELGRPGGALREFRLLGCGINPLPPERKKRDLRDKYLIFMTAYLSFPERIRLCEQENTAWHLVEGPDTVWELMGAHTTERPRKFELTCAAIGKAHELGCLTWSCHSLLTRAAA